MKKYKEHPLKLAFFMGAYNYVKQGNKLSNLTWFKGVDFGSLEKEKNPLKKAA